MRTYHVWVTACDGGLWRFDFRHRAQARRYLRRMRRRGRPARLGGREP
jgi:hypothetical protein